MIGAHGRDTWDATLERRRCTADAKGRLRGGAQPGTDDARCGNRPIPGGTTCRFHGSATAASRKAGALRLAAAADAAIDVLIAQVAKDDAVWTDLGDGTWKPVGISDRDKRSAAEAILERTGYPRRVEIDVDAGRRRLLERIRELRDQREDDE